MQAGSVFVVFITVFVSTLAKALLLGVSRLALSAAARCHHHFHFLRVDPFYSLFLSSSSDHERNDDTGCDGMLYWDTMYNVLSI